MSDTLPLRQSEVAPKPYYDDGTVTIYLGDALAVLPFLAADVLITDPPYGIGHASNRMGHFKGQRIANDSDVELRDAVLANWTGPAAVFGTWKRPRPSGVRGVLTWDKGEGVGMGDLTLPWRPNTEEIYVIGEGWRGHRSSSVLRDTSVVSWTGSGRGPRRLHPNEKPVPLLRSIIAKAPDHPVVLDPFMGSGTTLRAAKDLGRRAIGIEIEPRYCEVAVARLGQEVLDVA
jgi:DNA modification methylase